MNSHLNGQMWPEWSNWSLQLSGGCSSSSQAGALITPNLPLPVFQLSMTNEHSGNSFRHTHNPLSWCQQQKLMTMWIAGRQKMHYNGQQNCYPLQEGGGCWINWKVQCSFVFWEGDETHGGGVGSRPTEMSERFGRGWHATLLPCAWLWNASTSLVGQS